MLENMLKGLFAVLALGIFISFFVLADWAGKITNVALSQKMAEEAYTSSTVAENEMSGIALAFSAIFFRNLIAIQEQCYCGLPVDITIREEGNFILIITITKEGNKKIFSVIETKKLEGEALTPIVQQEIKKLFQLFYKNDVEIKKIFI